MKIDKIDQQILQLLQADSSISVSEVAERVNLSQPPCWRRIKRLEDEGYILQRTAILNPAKLGLNLVIYAEVKLIANGELANFEREVKTISEITECYVMLGNVDFLLRIVTTDIAGYERLYREQLSKLPGVQAFNTSVAMSEVKRSTQLPVTMQG
ncbi:AsnC family transcriptional regulator ['Osedax' symbiont bacterium Rs2_46_30_T18]|nr:AsnC family transcriptional regulator ['Osedax' symbiont bacterium Rs2_46_30_T18]